MRVDGAASRLNDRSWLADYWISSRECSRFDEMRDMCPRYVPGTSRLPMAWRQRPLARDVGRRKVSRTFKVRFTSRESTPHLPDLHRHYPSAIDAKAL